MAATTRRGEMTGIDKIGYQPTMKMTNKKAALRPPKVFFCPIF